MYPDSTQEGKGYNLVFYIDSVNATCTSCKFNDFVAAEQSYLDGRDIKNMSLTYIINVEPQDVSELYSRLCSSRVRCAVYMDTLRVFRKHNPQIPKEDMFHTFLLDENDSVVLVGDPIRNARIADLLKKVVNGEIKK